MSQSEIDFLKKVVVKVLINDEICGSGTLYRHNNKTFVLTAAHVVYGEKYADTVEKKQISIKIDTNVYGVIKKPVEELYTLPDFKSKDLDIIALQIDPAIQVKTFSLTNSTNIRNLCYFRGFPSFKKGEPTNFDNNRLNDNTIREKETFIIRDNDKTFSISGLNGSSKDFDGISGSGVFITINHQQYLCGIVGGYKDKKPALDLLECFEISLLRETDEFSDMDISVELSEENKKLVIDFEWFKTKAAISINSFGDKYDSDVHTSDEKVQKIIDFALMNKKCIETIDTFLYTIKQTYEYMGDRVSDDILNLEKYCNDTVLKKLLQNHLIKRNEFIKKLKDIKILIPKLDVSKISKEFIVLNTVITEYGVTIKRFRALINDTVLEYDDGEKRNLIDIIKSICNLTGNLHFKWSEFLSNIPFNNFKELHFLGGAGKGKTHLSCAICDERINKKLPAILLKASSFLDATDIEEALLKLLELNNCTITDLFLALEEYGNNNSVRIPIIIDGLNETIKENRFSDIWTYRLNDFISKIKSYSYIVLITTCRPSYRKQIWPNIILNDNEAFPPLYPIINGFTYHNFNEAKQRYFQKYNIKISAFYTDMDCLRELPYLLRIFCETKNKEYKEGNKVNLYYIPETTYDIFNDYLNIINQKICSNHRLNIIPNTPFVQNSLEQLADIFWNEICRSISRERFYTQIDNCNYNADTSKAKSLLDEGLVFDSDIINDHESVVITFELMAGYCIALYLLEKQTKSFFTRPEFYSFVSSCQREIYRETPSIENDNLHPLYENILDALLVLYPKYHEESLYKTVNRVSHSKAQNDPIWSCYLNNIKNDSINALFTTDSKYIDINDARELIQNVFVDGNKEHLLDLSIQVLADPKHPINANFWSAELEKLTITQRDIVWAEHLRNYADEQIEQLKDFVKYIEYTNHYIEESRLHLMVTIFQWNLSSTDRELRDLTTKVLYSYGRKYITHFAELVYKSLSFNDPYIPERMLCALYGSVLSNYNLQDNSNFLETELLPICRKIFELMFSSSAPHSTTHLLARDYANKIIELGLLYSPTFLNTEEIIRVRPPYLDGGIRIWENYYEQFKVNGHDVIQMDFENYEIAHIVEDDHGYANPPSKQEVKGQIYWRILDLGWDKETFSSAEESVGYSNYNDNRTNRKRIERYGKKYSWIAYYEIAGFRADNGLLANEWNLYRKFSDIDPTFTKKYDEHAIVKETLLGDLKEPHINWIINGSNPDLSKYLICNNLPNFKNEWTCLDAWIQSNDIHSNRQRLTKVRSMFVSTDTYNTKLVDIEIDYWKTIRVPDKVTSQQTFGDEIYLFNSSTSSNWKEFSIVTGVEKKMVKPGDSGYPLPSRPFEIIDGVTISYEDCNDLEEKEIENDIIKSFDALLPVQEYNWESDTLEEEHAGKIKILAKEIVLHLELKKFNQTFNLVDQDGNIATLGFKQETNYHNAQNELYIRKDLLDKYLEENNLQMIWVVWGERNIAITDDIQGNYDSFRHKHKIEPRSVFQDVIEYPSMNKLFSTIKHE